MPHLHRLWGFVAVAAVVSGSLVGPAVGAEPKKIVTVEGITEYRLDNGLRVLLFPDKSKPRVTVNMTVFVGSRHEGYGETGMAHLLEHMVFKGTPDHPSIPKAMAERGAQFNGTTSTDRTNYFETLTASDENLEFAIFLEADRLVNSTIKAEDLASEFTVVRNEFEMGENSARGVLDKRIMAAAFEWHNYGKSTIGNRSDIERVPVDNLRAFYRKFYQPDNAMVVVAGQFDEAKALRLIQKHFGAIPRPARKLDQTYTEEPPQDGERTVTLRRVGEVGAVGVAYHVPAGPHPDFPSLQVLGDILGDQASGRLHKALVESKKASNASASARPLHDPGVLSATATVPRDGSLEEVRDMLLGIIEGIGKDGVTAEEVDRAKVQILNARERALAETSRLAVSLSEWAAQGDWRLFFLHRDAIEKVTPESVKAAAAKYLVRNNRTVGLYIPTEKPERIAVPVTPDVKTLVADYKGRATIAEGEAIDLTPAGLEARVERKSLPQGIKVAMLPKKTRGEEVHLTLTLRFGNEENLKGLTSVGSYLPALMLRGTKNLTRQQLQDELDKLKATLSTGGGGGRGRGGRGGGPPAAATASSVSFSIQAKKETLPAVLELLRDVLREPTLPAEDFEVMKRERLAGLEQMRAEPAALAGLELQRRLSSYPKDDLRYIPTLDEQIERQRAITIEQVRQLHRDYLGSAAGEVTIVGDFDPDACLNILASTLSGWTPAKPYARIANPFTKPAEPGGLRINTPDKANATFTAGMVMPMDNKDPDYPALVIANNIFGGGTLSSRLGDRVRQKEGLSYGITSSFSADAIDRRARFTVSAICNPQNMEKLATAVSEEFDRMIRDGVTADELARAKKGYLDQQRVGRTSDSTLAGLLGGLLYDGRTMAYYADLEKRIEGLTAEQVSAAFRKHIDPKKFVIIRAGDLGAQSTGEN